VWLIATKSIGSTSFLTLHIENHFPARHNDWFLQSNLWRTAHKSPIISPSLHHPYLWAPRNAHNVMSTALCSVFPSLSHRFSFPLSFLGPKWYSDVTVQLHGHMFKVLSHQTSTVFRLAPTAAFWKPLIMASKWKSSDFNMKPEIMCEVSSSSKSKGVMN
jgi:hypothetical protein